MNYPKCDVVTWGQASFPQACQPTQPWVLYDLLGGKREMLAEKQAGYHNQVEFKVTGCLLMMDFPHFFQNEKSYQQTEIFPSNGAQEFI